MVSDFVLGSYVLSSKPKTKSDPRWADPRWAALFDELGQVVTIDGLHRENDALADPRRRVGGDDVGVMELRRGADLAEEPLQHPLAVQEVGADDLEDLLPPHHSVLGQVDYAHASASQLPQHLVVRVLGQARRQCAGRWRRGRARLSAQP